VLVLDGVLEARASLERGIAASADRARDDAVVGATAEHARLDRQAQH
jgi:hypothetical protein